MDRIRLKKNARNLVMQNMGVFSVLTLFNILAMYGAIIAGYDILVVLCWNVVISFTGVMLAKANVHASQGKSMKLKDLMSDLGVPTIKQFISTMMISMLTLLTNKISYVFLQLVKGNVTLSALPVIAIIAIILLSVMVLYIQIRLGFVSFIATDDRFDDLGVMDTLKVSWKITKKEVLNILVLNLSFGWWYLGMVMTMGMVSFYAIPYIYQALELFYEGLLRKNV